MEIWGLNSRNWNEKSLDRFNGRCGLAKEKMIGDRSLEIFHPEEEEEKST